MERIIFLKNPFNNDHILTMKTNFAYLKYSWHLREKPHREIDPLQDCTKEVGNLFYLAIIHFVIDYEETL